jgi:hypothetical protein
MQYAIFHFFVKNILKIPLSGQFHQHLTPAFFVQKFFGSFSLVSEKYKKAVQSTFV